MALAALAAVLGFALVRPRGWPEAVAAVPAAVILLAAGAISWRDATAEIRQLLPVVAFLAAVLVLARLCDDEGLFRAAGAAMARTGWRAPHRLPAMVFGIAAGTTAILSLDATVVLLTPIVLATARTLTVPAKPYAYATAHLANSASLLLPVSNLTNLLAFGVAGLSFLHFTAVMAAPWVTAVAVEFVLWRYLFARELRVEPARDLVATTGRRPLFALVVVALTLLGFAATSLIGIAPAWAAVGGAIVLGLHALARGRSTVAGIARAVDVPFLVFVLCLGVVVAAVMGNGLGAAMHAVVPHGHTLPALLGLAVVAAAVCNVVNNLPAVLLLLPLVEHSGPAAVLAVLIGVNIGPNLSYPGSLANLLWRRVVRHDIDSGFGEFTRIGLCTTPITLVASVVALWAGVEVIGV